MTPHAVAASFCAACTALFSALLFFPHCAALEFILNLKALRYRAKSKFCRFEISTSRLNLKFKSRGKSATCKWHKIKFDCKDALQKSLNIKISKLALRRRASRRNRQNLKPYSRIPLLNLKGEISRPNFASIKFQSAVEA